MKTWRTSRLVGSNNILNPKAPREDETMAKNDAAIYGTNLYLSETNSASHILNALSVA